MGPCNLVQKVDVATKVSVAMAELTMADTIGLVMHNAVTAQRNMQTTTNSAIAVVCTIIISKGTK